MKIIIRSEMGGVKDLEVPDSPETPLLTVLKDAGVEVPGHVAVLVDGILQNVNRPAAAGSTVEILPPLSGG